MEELQKEIEENSRNVFGNHHISEQSNEQLYKRKFDRINYEYLELPEGWFKGKKALDAASGTALSNTHKLLELGAEVTSLDLPGDHEFDESRIKDKFKGKYKLMRGNILALPFEDNTFDYVHCEGALHHTIHPKKGFMELARVTKPGGYLYVTAFGTPGIFREVEDFLREKYKKGQDFQKLIDTLTEEKLQAVIKWINANLKEDHPPIPLELFDQDLVVTIKDRLQAPIYTRHSTTEVLSWYKEAVFKTAKRITRYPKGCKNMRRYMSPIYEQWNHPLSKFINGDGFIQVIGQK
ncbi:unnamed protein product [marine sediment metagenome]|uniref:Methyltransferase type 11 domain-containing protein n=1 Tax=marine sediment metagenome TaxID=412755 RepID=X0S9R4_9ZZZZ